MRRLAQFAAVLMVAVFTGCSAPERGFSGTATVSPPQFTFAALGDTPYTPDEEARFIGLIGDMNREQLAFTVHVGDFKSGVGSCSNEVFLQRSQWFGLSHHPFIYIPGDNDWTDCHRVFAGGRDPLERLDKLRALFFQGGESLGQRRLQLTRQSTAGTLYRYPEHMRWTHRRVLFATLNVPGGDNNLRRMPEEFAQRGPAVHDWIRQAFRIAREEKLPAVVLMMQANPWTAWALPRLGYAEFLDLLTTETRRYEGEVLLIHGDTHRHRVDHPLLEPDTRQPLANFTRLEVFGSPIVNWVRVNVRNENGRLKFDASPGS